MAVFIVQVFITYTNSFHEINIYIYLNYKLIMRYRTTRDFKYLVIIFCINCVVCVQTNCNRLKVAWCGFPFKNVRLRKEATLSVYM